MQDIWKDIIGYEGLYKISNTGKVRNVERYIVSGDGEKLVKGRILKSNAKVGYLNVALRKFGNSKTFTLHRLLALHFIPNHDNKSCINHIDGNKQNNSLENLEWCTHSENTQHAYDIGLMKKPSKWDYEVDSIEDYYYSQRKKEWI